MYSLVSKLSFAAIQLEIFFSCNLSFPEQIFLATTSDSSVGYTPKEIELNLVTTCLRLVVHVIVINNILYVNWDI